MQHFEAMPYDDTAAFVAKFRAERHGIGAMALEALIFAACRSGDIQCSTQDEIDLKAE